VPAPAIREVRGDIQGLRALAVLLVMVFHLWPDRLGGGFVGVDVFFVVSGFLITSHLVRAPPRRPVDVVRFWGRRLRRLLPASLLVIVVTVILAIVIFPVTRLQHVVTDALASTFYVENWRLAASSVDYLAARTPASPLEHYWSLGVEEQFYLLWPVLIGLLALGRSRLLVPGIAAVLALSLGASVVWTAADPAVAYFATPARLWEFAAGGLLGVLPLFTAVGRRGRAALAWAGILIILVSAVLITPATPYPGVAALLPVLGTILVLVADSTEGRLSPARLLAARPVRWVGDASYSIYLWHFPVIVFATFVLGDQMPALVKAVLLAGSVALGWLTWRFVETPPRLSAWLRPTRRTFGLAAAATLVVAVLALTPALRVSALDAQAESVRADVIAANEGCLGAEALASASCAVTSGEAFMPSPGRAIDDFSVAYDDGCLAPAPFAEVVTCEYGQADAPALRVALAGNSHAAQWLPALQELAGERRMLITTYLAVGCMPTAATLVLATPAASEGCREWGGKVVDAVSAGGYDLVVASAASVFAVAGEDGASGYAAQVAGFAPVLEAWRGSRVLVIRDTPFPGFDIPECVETRGVAACEGARSQWVPPDPLAAAVTLPGHSVVDLNHLFCSPATCYPVIGGILVYVDYSHFGATFARTLAPALAPALDDALRN